MNIEFNKEKLEEIIGKLNQEINNLETIYNDIDKKLESTDGTHELWKGSSQQAFYDYYKDVATDFPNALEKFRDYRDFLKMVITNYENAENDIDSDIEENSDSLDVD